MRTAWGSMAVGILATAALSGGCGGGGAPVASNTLVYARGGESESLDPIHTDSGESVKVITNLFETLVTYADDSAELVPGLAQRWETDAGGRTYTFHLRPGITFHDGTPLDAEAVVFTFERLIQPGHPHVHLTRIPYATDFSVIRAVEAADAHTVVFHLHQPSAVFLANLAMFPASIVSPTAVKQEGLNFARRPIGTGPFRLLRWERDRELVLAANENYWQGRPKLDRVIFVPIVEGIVRSQRLQHGSVHLAEDLPPPEIDALEGREGIVVQAQQGMNVGYLTMQNEHPPLDRVEVRRAIARAIDKRKLIDLLFNGRAVPATSMVPPTLWGHDATLPELDYDPPAARAAMEQAAARHGFSLPVSLKLHVMASPRPYMQQPVETADFIKSELKAIGIECQIVINEISQHFQRLSAGEHDLGLIGWSTDNADPDNFLYQLLHPDNINDAGGNNTSRFRDPRVAELLVAAKVELDRSRREALYHQAQQLIFEQMPVVPLVHTEIRVAHVASLRGYRLHPTGLVRLFPAWFEETAP